MSWVETNAFARRAPPSAELVADLLESPLAVHVSVEVVDAEIVREADEDFHEIERALELIGMVVRSYGGHRGHGLPLGNVTSQLFGNAYMDGFDHFVKERLRMRWYARFCDDFLIIHDDRSTLEGILPRIREFLTNDRLLALHPRKVTIRKYAYGIDCVGTVLRPYAQTLRHATVRRAMRTIRMRTDEYRTGELTDARYRSMLQSFFGLCAHGSNHHVRRRMREMAWRMLREVVRDVSR